MPLTKTAKRALRSSKRKEGVNQLIKKNLEISIRRAKAQRSDVAIKTAISLSDRAAKKKVIDKNKAGRIKSQLSKFLKVKTRLVKKNKPAKKKTTSK